MPVECPYSWSFQLNKYAFAVMILLYCRTDFDITTIILPPALSQHESMNVFLRTSVKQCFIYLGFLVFMTCHSLKWIPNIWEWTQIGRGEKEMFWPVWMGEYWLYFVLVSLQMILQAFAK